LVRQICSGCPRPFAKDLRAAGGYSMSLVQATLTNRMRLDNRIWVDGLEFRWTRHDLVPGWLTSRPVQPAAVLVPVKGKSLRDGPLGLP
jgi:hypothetical protein